MTIAPNPDHVLMRAFMAGDGVAVAVETNGLFRALNTTLVGYDAGARTVTLRYEPGDLFRQGSGVMQGGAISAMLDFAMAFAAMTTVELTSSVTTTAMNTTFYAAGNGAVYEALGKVEKPGRRVVFTSAILSCEGRQIAAATSTLLVV
ncbi:MAG: PaaI family thioesterase [Rhizobiaceae bacterium]|nr:PaaI family thioesterase [Rhizobiaceae bacterium]